MTFKEWWDSEERDEDWFLPIITQAAWDAAVVSERERCAAVCEALSAKAGRILNAVGSLEGDTGYKCAEAIRAA